MCSSSTGVLVFNAEASIEQVDATAATLLNADRTSLLRGTADALNRPVSGPNGTSYSSLSAFVERLLAGDTSTPCCHFSEGIRAEARRTSGADTPTGVVVMLTPSPSPEPSQAPSAPQLPHARLVKHLASGASLSDVLARLIRGIEAERPDLLGSILLFDPDSETLHHGAAPSLPESFSEAIDGLPIGPTAGSCGTAAFHNETVIVEDIAEDERWADYRDLALAHDLRASWSTPIRGDDGAVLGTFAFYYTEPRAPSALDRALIEEASALARLAISYDRQQRELHRQSDQLRRLVENAQPVVFFLDEDGTFLLSEGEDLAAVGLEPGEVVGESIYDIYADHPTLLDYVDRALAGESIDAILEVEGVTFDIWYAPYYDRTGNVAGCIGMAVDITERRRMESQLREQKEWLQSITENISGGIYRSTDDGLVYANQAFIDLFGYDSLEEMKKVDPTDFYANPGTRERLLRHETEQGELDGVEVEYRRKDGSTFIGLLRSTQAADAEGTLRYYDGVVTDISEQKARERKLRDQGEKMEALYRATKHLLAADDPDAVATQIHSLLTDTFAYPLTGVSFLKDETLVPVCTSIEDGSDAAPMQRYPITSDSLCARAVRTQETVVAEDLSDVDNTIDYGSLRAAVCVPLGTHGALYLGRSNPGPFDDFDLRLIDVLAKKATVVLDRLEHEAHLHASEQRFRGLFEEAALGIALVDSEARIVEANPELASMIGTDPEALSGQHFNTITHPDDREKGASKFAELIDGNRDRYEFEKRYVRTDDTVFWAHITVSLHDGPGTAEVIAMIENISERKHYEQQLRAAKREAEETSRLKSALLANMSHEIRTPLTSIIGFAGVLRENLAGQYATYARRIHEGGKRLMDTLDSVLQLSRLEAGVTDPTAEDMDLVAVARETVDLYQSQAASNDLDLQFSAAVDTALGEWDPAIVRRILSNLLSNGLKFTPEGGTVTVRVHASEDEALLTVADTGIGIDEDFRDRLFDAFTQESDGLQREHEGTGLGLAIVKRLVDLLEGTIEVESMKGEGTRFDVRLPR